MFFLARKTWRSKTYSGIGLPSVLKHCIMLYQAFCIWREWKTFLRIYYMFLFLGIILGFVFTLNSDLKARNNSWLLHISSSYKTSSKLLFVFNEQIRKWMLLIKNLINNPVNNAHHNRIHCSFISFVVCKTVKRSRKLWWLQCTLIFMWGSQADCIENASKILRSHQRRSYRRYFQQIYLVGFFYGCPTRIKLEWNVGRVLAPPPARPRPARPGRSRGPAPRRLRRRRGPSRARRCSRRRSRPGAGPLWCVRTAPARSGPAAVREGSPGPTPCQSPCPAPRQRPGMYRVPLDGRREPLERRPGGGRRAQLGCAPERQNPRPGSGLGSSGAARGTAGLALPGSTREGSVAGWAAELWGSDSNENCLFIYLFYFTVFCLVYLYIPGCLAGLCWGGGCAETPRARSRASQGSPFHSFAGQGWVCSDPRRGSVPAVPACSAAPQPITTTPWRCVCQPPVLLRVLLCHSGTYWLML